MKIRQNFVVAASYLLSCAILLFVSSPRRHFQFERSQILKVPTGKVRTNVTRHYMRLALFKTTLDDPCCLDDSSMIRKSYESLLSFPHRIDIVVAAYKRSAKMILEHLEKCLLPSTRVYVYVATYVNQLKNDSLEFAHKASNEKERLFREYVNFNTSFEKFIVSVPNMG